MAVPDLTRLLTGFQGTLILNPTQLQPATPPAVGTTWSGLGSGGNFTIGNHTFGFTFVYSGGVESLMSPTTTLFINPNGQVSLGPSVLAPPNVVTVNLYATHAGGSTPFLLATQTPLPGGGFGGTFTKSDAQLTVAYGGGVAAISGFPYGGTQLGEVMDLVVTPRRRTREIHGEEFGPDETIEVVDSGEGWKLTAALRGVDPDLFGLVMAAPSTTGAPSGRPKIKYPGAATQAGAFLTQRSGLPASVLLLPKDAKRLPSFMFYAVVPVLDASARLTLQLDREGTLGAVFYCLRNTSNHVLEWGMLEDLAVA